MDPLAHTLVGATLAESPIARSAGSRIPLATATLLIGANLPDIDFVLYFVSADPALAHRRGWTHGVLAMAVLPLLLTVGVLLWDRWVRRRKHPDRLPARPVAILGLAILSVFTHPALDWLNTYGVRLLMPFDGRWFYGDSLFIIEPWIWLLLGGAVFLARAPRGRKLALWIVLAALTSIPVLGAPAPSGIDPLIPKVLWVAGLGGIAALRLRGFPTRLPSPRLANRVLAVLGMYLLLSVASTWIARHQVLEDLASQGISIAEPGRDLMVGPLPYNPLVRDVVAKADAYHVGRFHWLPGPRLELTDTLPLPEPSPELAAAQRASCVQGFLVWVRFPYTKIEETGQGSTRVHLMDARYTRRRTSGFGSTTVEILTDGEPSCP